MSFGIYIKTCRRDHHLAKALIASLRRFAPEEEITIIPGDGHTEPTLWGEKAMVSDDPFLLSLTGFFKKLWIFFGPYDRFLYLDADMLALRPLGDLLEQVRTAPKPFWLVHCRPWMVESMDDELRRKMCDGHLGPLDLLENYAPEFDWRTFVPFNSGLIGSHRDVFDSYFLKAEFEKARPQLRRGRRLGLFGTDQGFLNYLCWRAGVTPTRLMDAFHWGAKPATEGDHLFVHWCGCPRPRLFRTGVPYGREWQKDYLAFYRTNRRWHEMAYESAAIEWAMMRRGAPSPRGSF